MTKTTLCYISVGDKILMIRRCKKKNDPNEGKYLGIGGHFEEGETPEVCARREVFEESGIVLDDCAYRGIVNFYSDVYEDEEMHLFTASVKEQPLRECDEGELCLITKEKLFSLPMWTGDRIFLKLLFDGAEFFELSLRYEGDELKEAVLNGKTLNI